MSTRMCVENRLPETSVTPFLAGPPSDHFYHPSLPLLWLWGENHFLAHRGTARSPAIIVQTHPNSICNGGLMRIIDFDTGQVFHRSCAFNLGYNRQRSVLRSNSSFLVDQLFMSHTRSFTTCISYCLSLLLTMNLPVVHTSTWRSLPKYGATARYPTTMRTTSPQMQ
ncbi:hypothetical protein P153DRAFT_364900 [Dothidotthia symphoricarpi CBS 119687]|uniref:Uncharacterized protein n=1 Tax=Dothidotthia symphoricarpi CBS 119687 TaxID=1392245 RepID=A0A6A6AK96_9PLEO|nr:uncharacterized protein P153DRAFT_364900 [Dothidotthia symphoricarpi CBS 119687]KAF2131297.1 hypothetical protein P153DRAFT_364900 [Dothidotthia symphoricarpi CBS 119687]